MNITVNVEIDKSAITNFEELVSNIRNQMLKAGQEVMREILERTDECLRVERDTKVYREKGIRKTTVKTLLGDIEYKRRIYEDLRCPEKSTYVYLLDEALGIEKVGLIGKDVSAQAVSMICETSYRETAAALTKLTGTQISHQGVWNLIQKVGRKQKEQIARHAVLAKKGKHVGVIDTKLLYEENDGIYLKLQGREQKKEHQSSKEMKIGIAYTGAVWQGKAPYRRYLDNKLAYASFEGADAFRKNKEGLIGSRFNLDEIDMRIINGDGAGWVTTSSASCEKVRVLDKFHRNRKITECVKDPEFARTVRQLLMVEKNIPLLLDVLEGQVNSLENEDEKEKMQELYTYFQENQDILLNPYEREIAVPETIAPGTIHHARLGSMESNVFTLVGNRMKGRRRTWSVAGGNNLALLICLKKTVGFEHLFTEAEEEEEWVDTGNPLATREAMKRIGKGYEYYQSSRSIYGWMRDIMSNVSAVDLVLR